MPAKEQKQHQTAQCDNLFHTLFIYSSTFMTANITEGFTLQPTNIR